MKEKLAFTSSLLEAYAIGMKNIASIIAAAVLYVLTIWIPYINVGTTIAICNLPVELSKGGVINPLSIFDAKYRHQMGEFILLYGVMLIGIIVAALFMYFPAIVIALTWSQAIYLLLDKKINWAQCLTESNRMTMGYKWKIFFLKIALAIPLYILMLIAGLLGVVGIILIIVIVMVGLAADISLEAVIYRELSKTDDEPSEEVVDEANEENTTETNDEKVKDAGDEWKS